MSIKTLIELMPPPDRPVDSEGDWDAVEAELGLRLPQDYKSYVKIYGRGQIGDFLGVYDPFSTSKYSNLLYHSRTHAELQHESKQNFLDLMPYDFFPAPGGLLPIMQTDNGDLVYWLTSGDPDAWKLVVNGSRDFRYQEFYCGVTSFISGIFTGKLQCETFPQLDITVPIAFQADPVPDPGGVEPFVPKAR